MNPDESNQSSSAPPPPVDALHDASEAADGNRAARHIRSFVLRQGRLSSAQARAITQGMHITVAYQAAPMQWAEVFGRDAPRVVEIGFGMGHATADIAALRPSDDFIGIEVHTPGVGSLLKMLNERAVSNVRVVQHDAVDVMTHMITDASLAGIHVFFPDPWPKKRHHKRRLLQPAFVKLLATKLRLGGYLHCATDWQDYAEQMLAVLSAEPMLQNSASANTYAARPAYRTESNFERRGLRLGHGVWDLVFERRA
jgi:tRNA (guanine-N7-)-methyltransferase